MRLDKKITDMRKGLIIVMSCLMAFIGSAQISNNQQQILELEKKIEQHASKSEFKQAAELQEELKLRSDLEDAIANDDIHRAARIQKRIEGTDQISVVSKRPVTFFEKASVRNAHFFIDLISIGVNNYSATYMLGNQSTMHKEDVSSLTFGIQIGQHFFFNPPTIGKPRFGLSFNYIGVSGMRFAPSTTGANVNLLRPGMIMNTFLTENAGIDLVMHVGASVLDQGYTNGPQNRYALSFSPHIKFWMTKVNLGIQYNFARMVYNDASLHTIGLTFGVSL